MVFRRLVANLIVAKATILSDTITHTALREIGGYYFLKGRLFMTKRISNHLLSQNKVEHCNIDFVNTAISRDEQLFIDPVLIEVGTTSFCDVAKRKTADFFSQLHTAYYVDNNEKRKKYLLKHAREINDTHLGYAKKHGKGNTEEGLYDIFKGIDDYITSIKINRMFELVLYVPEFAEDGMSDLLTNILYKELSEFTVQQCQKYNIETQICPKERFYWDSQTHTWIKYTGQSLVIDGNIHLLVPKEIVQTHYRFTTDNFLRSVIVENICEAEASYDKNGKKSRPQKDKVRENLLKQNGTIFDTVHKFAEGNDDLLKQYQKIVDEKYRALTLSDEELDMRIYK